MTDLTFTWICWLSPRLPTTETGIDVGAPPAGMCLPAFRVLNGVRAGRGYALAEWGKGGRPHGRTWNHLQVPEVIAGF